MLSKLDSYFVERNKNSSLQGRVYEKLFQEPCYKKNIVETFDQELLEQKRKVYLMMEKQELQFKFLSEIFDTLGLKKEHQCRFVYYDSKLNPWEYNLGIDKYGIGFNIAGRALSYKPGQFFTEEYYEHLFKLYHVIEFCITVFIHNHDCKMIRHENPLKIFQNEQHRWQIQPFEWYSKFDPTCWVNRWIYETECHCPGSFFIMIEKMYAPLRNQLQKKLKGKLLYPFLEKKLSIINPVLFNQYSVIDKIVKMSETPKSINIPFDVKERLETIDNNKLSSIEITKYSNQLLYIPPMNAYCIEDDNDKNSIFFKQPFSWESFTFNSVFEYLYYRLFKHFTLSDKQAYQIVKESSYSEFDVILGNLQQKYCQRHFFYELEKKLDSFEMKMEILDCELNDFEPEKIWYEKDDVLKKTIEQEKKILKELTENFETTSKNTVHIFFYFEKFVNFFPENTCHDTLWNLYCHFFYPHYLSHLKKIKKSNVISPDLLEVIDTSIEEETVKKIITCLENNPKDAKPSLIQICKFWMKMEDEIFQHILQNKRNFYKILKEIQYFHSNFQLVLWDSEKILKHVTHFERFYVLKNCIELLK